MRTGRALICSFDAVDLKAADKRSYPLFREKVLAAGRFSVFEATENDTVAKLYTRLCSDPEVVTDHENFGFPWTGVAWRTTPTPKERRAANNCAVEI